MYEEEDIEPEFMKRDKTNPFRTPDRYFDSLEDRIMGGIKSTTKNKITSAKIIRLLKPVLGLAASFTVAYIMLYSPINNFLIKGTVKSEVAVTNTTNALDDSTLNFSMIDDNTLVNAIISDEPSNVSGINSDDMLAYLSSGMNEVEIYSEIQNRNHEEIIYYNHFISCLHNVPECPGKKRDDS